MKKRSPKSKGRRERSFDSANKMTIKGRITFLNMWIVVIAIIVILITVFSYRVQIYFNKKKLTLSELETTWISLERNLYYLSFNWDRGLPYENIRQNISTFTDNLDALKRKNILSLFDTEEIKENHNKLRSLWKYVKDSQLDPIIVCIEEVFDNNSVFSFEQTDITEVYYNELFKKNKQIFSIYRLLEDVKSLSLSSEAFKTVLISSVDNINIVEKQVAYFVNIIIIVLLTLEILTGFILSAISGNSIFKPILRLIDGIKILGKNDLTFKFKIRSKRGTREVINAVTTYNDIVDKIKNILINVKSSTQRSRQIGDSLSANAGETSTTVNEITSNIHSIKKQFTYLDNNISSSSKDVEQIRDNINNLADQISNQAGAVEQLSSSVEEMTASIDNVAIITRKKKESTDSLVNITQIGGEKVNETNEIITDISKSADRMLEMIDLINEISSQTDLLALNAAIEAAHAGEHGKGFAVVADETRKLSESTHSNAKDISISLKETIAKIHSASAQSIESGNAFNIIREEVTEVSNSFSEISNSMVELSGGNSEISEAISTLLNVTEEVKGSSDEIKTNTENINKTMHSVKEISTEVINGLNEIVSGTNEINTAIMQVAEISRENSDSIAELDNRIKQFKTA